MNSAAYVLQLDNVERHYKQGENILSVLSGANLALRPGETVRIEQVSGHGVATAGAAAYDAVVAACTGGQPVLLGDADTQWPAPCNQPLPARPPRFELLAPS